MKITVTDDYHGAVFSQLVMYPAFKSLNKAIAPLGFGTGYGHYLLNADRHFFVKYSAKKRRPWYFSFSKSDINALVEARLVTTPPVWILLVCGKKSICGITLTELDKLIDIIIGGAAQTLRVDELPGGSLGVTGTASGEKKTIPHNRFPKALFSPVKATVK